MNLKRSGPTGPWTSTQWAEASRTWRTFITPRLEGQRTVSAVIQGEDLTLPCASALALWHEMTPSFEGQSGAKVPPSPQLHLVLCHLQGFQALFKHLVTWGLWLDSSDPWNRPLELPGWQRLTWPERGLTVWMWQGDELSFFKAWKGGADLCWVEQPALLQRFNGLAAKQGRPPVQSGQWSDCGRLQPPSQQPMQLGPVAVVGAGIAGSCTARALAQAGFEVHLLDAASGPASGASGNWAGAFHPHLTRDDSPLSQLTRLGCQFSLQALAQLTLEGFLRKGVDWDCPGHFQSVPEPEQARAVDTLSRLDWPAEYVRWQPAGELGSLPGLFFPHGAWVKTPQWVNANLKACGARLQLHWGAAVDSMDALHSWMQAQYSGPWAGAVLATAQSTPSLTGLGWGRSNQVKGQITRMSRPFDAAPLPCSVSGEAYAIAPPAEQWTLLGATYERPVLNLDPTEAADESNLHRFKQTFPNHELGPRLDHRCAVRYVWPDRLPVVGQLAGQSVWLNTAYASRGLTWAAMAADCLTQQLLAQQGATAPWQPTLLSRLAPRQEWGSGV